ncbi:ABC transporter permease [Nordella sp. HKS 07]|uniref:ABC transporter permease n=1 Tax=Nordella sp. HKS 07 TaxID=2712222 RepID=UPI0013E19689|nr:ABC transporter permease [Nordella sp. HKS 07]
MAHQASAKPGAIFWLGVLIQWALIWIGNDALSGLPISSPLAMRLRNLAVPAIFGVTLLLLWQLVVKGFGIPLVLLPAPSDIWAKLSTSLPILEADFIQTFLRAVLPGWFIGSLAGFLVAIMCDAWGFLKRGLLPLGNLFAALPIVGVAPIMVMWFGFDWQSKVAVVVIMTFFPMLVNAVTGLQAAGALERDLMRSYGASYLDTLLKLRLPAAMPFIFNALKINSTLALIGAIVAEFFGTPIVGMGFRISTEVGRLGLDMVWAEIAVAAIAGSAFYGIIALIERAVTFWHPSYRARKDR